MTKDEFLKELDEIGFRNSLNRLNILINPIFYKYFF